MQQKNDIAKKKRKNFKYFSHFIRITYRFDS